MLVIEYTDETFAKVMPIPQAERYRGLVGPTIHAEVGDTVVIVFRNRTRLQVDIAPTGVVSIPKPAAVGGSPADVDREIVTLFSSQLEDQNPLVEENLHDRIINRKGISQHGRSFFIDNAFPSINGYVYGNMPMPTMRANSRVRWYLLSSMNGFDGHTPTWSGQTVIFQGNRSDAVGLIFRQAVVDMTPDDPGIWLLTCSNDIHLSLGMEARYEVMP